MTKKHQGKHLGVAKRQSPVAYIAANGQVVRHATHVRSQGMRREGKAIAQEALNLNEVPEDKRSPAWHEAKVALLKREEQFLLRGLIQVPIYRGMDIRAVRTVRAAAKKLKDNPMYFDARNVKYVRVRSGIARTGRPLEEMHLGHQ